MDLVFDKVVGGVQYASFFCSSLAKISPGGGTLHWKPK